MHIYHVYYTHVNAKNSMAIRKLLLAFGRRESPHRIACTKRPSIQNMVTTTDTHTQKTSAHEKRSADQPETVGGVDVV